MGLESQTTGIISLTSARLPTSLHAVPLGQLLDHLPGLREDVVLVAAEELVRERHRQLVGG